MKIFLLFPVISFILLMATNVSACDPLGCLFSGHNQDTLILGEVVSASEDVSYIKISFVFPQNKLRDISVGKQLKLGSREPTVLTDRQILKKGLGIKLRTPYTSKINKKPEKVELGKKYLFSLNKRKNHYIIAYGFYELKGEKYSDMQLVKNSLQDDMALQLFINSGGEDRQSNDNKNMWYQK